MNNISPGSRARLIYRAAFVLALFLAAPEALAGQEDDGHSVILNIALCVVAASGLGLLMKFLRQPLILGHILAGVLIGPIGLGLIKDHTQIITIAEIGLILLLFMIGLEIDLRKMLESGKLVIIPGLLQFPICLGLGYLIFEGLDRIGVPVGENAFARFYLAIAISISSTMIVVKMLYEKFELDTLPGRITLGILVFQDIWAIIILALQPNLNNPNVVAILKTFGAGGLLVIAALAMSRYVLPYVFKSIAKLPELMLIISLGWCFLVSLVAANPKVGLSMEMGALIAGVSLATFPYNMDVTAKVLSLRDFFITLFFVALGMQIPVPELRVILVALLVVLAALVTRWFGVFGVLRTMRTGHRAGILSTLNLSQVSEFALVIIALGIGYGHITQQTMTYVIWVFSIMAVASTYLISYSHPLQDRISRALSAIGLKDIGEKESGDASSGDYPIVILGFYRIASALLEEISRNFPKLLSKIQVIDFNPDVKKKLDAMGVACAYGDISHLDTLHHADIHGAEIVLSTIPDPILKGIDNQQILEVIRNHCPRAKVFLTAEKPSHALALYQAGADFVIQPSALSGSVIAWTIEQAVRGDFTNLREREIQRLRKREEVLA